jgi:hypothetical protein
MRRLIQCAADLSRDSGFTRFQNDTVQCFYDTLDQGYSVHDNEVALVTRLVNAANGKSYGPVRLLANKIHGSRSYVEFSFMGKPVTKELGDMAIISVVTAGRDRLFQRVSIIQNKKSSGTNWGIDSEQLFLLKNFPPFAGNRGIFRGCSDLAFRNESRCLGAYGLFDDPGEMVFVSAPLVAGMLSGKKSLGQADLSVSLDAAGLAPTQAGGFPWWPGLHHCHPRELYHILRELCDFHDFPFMCPSGSGGGFLGNIVFGRDLYDFVRAWTRLSVGEVTYAHGTVLNAEVDAFTNLLIAAAGFRDLFDMPGDEVFPQVEFSGDLAVVLMHLDVSHGG